MLGHLGMILLASHDSSEVTVMSLQFTRTHTHIYIYTRDDMHITHKYTNPPTIGFDKFLIKQ